MEGIRKTISRTIDNLVDYYLRNYRKMVFIPIMLIVFFSASIGYHYITHGQLINEGISLSGGISLSLSTTNIVSPEIITTNLTSALGTPVSVSVLHSPLSNAVTGYTITAGTGVNSTALSNAVSKLFGISLTSSNSSVNFVGASLAQSALYDSALLLGIAFILVAIVSLFYFRNFAQAFSNVISIVSDVINVVGLLDIIGLHFSTASIAGILMVMGYSADRNIILATNILKRKEASMKYRLTHTIKTSLTMDAAALITFLVLFFGSSNSIIHNIAIILIFGVIFDDFAVWILNGSIQLAAIGYKEEPKPAATV
jgi:preprotein translocase subunit SecF